MHTTRGGATRSPVIAACAALGGLLLLWITQPFLPGWACAASLPAGCAPHLLPVRASLISAGILVVLLATVVVGLLLQARANHWVGGFSRLVVFIVPIVLVLTVVAHFFIPQP